MSQNGLLPGATIPSLGFDWKAPFSERSDHENLIHSIDWSGTAVGPPSEWPVQLREAVDFVLADPTPAAVMWGEDLTVRDHFLFRINTSTKLFETQAFPILRRRKYIHHEFA
jgi:hypothetical protein